MNPKSRNLDGWRYDFFYFFIRNFKAARQLETLNQHLQPNATKIKTNCRPAKFIIINVVLLTMLAAIKKSYKLSEFRNNVNLKAEF